jgi:hypothetical protein
MLQKLRESALDKSLKCLTYLVGFVERTGFDGIAPLPKEVRNAIVKARQLPAVVEY